MLLDQIDLFFDAGAISDLVPQLCFERSRNWVKMKVSPNASARRIGTHESSVGRDDYFATGVAEPRACNR
jgi:hypothetical protein